MNQQDKIKDWINEKGISKLERTLRVLSVRTYTFCLLNPQINVKNTTNK